MLKVAGVVTLIACIVYGIAANMSPHMSTEAAYYWAKSAFFLGLYGLARTMEAND